MKYFFLALAAIASSAMAQDGKYKVLKDSLESITTATQELGSVSVVAKVQRTRMNGNVMVTRIVGSPLANAGSAEEMLAHVPGMLMRNGSLEVLGKGSPIFYINGRKVQDPTELQRLSSQEIREVEVINTPGAQYDAQVNAVVRIRTVKRRDQGIGGSFETRDRYSPSHGDNRLNTTFSLNYRHKALELNAGATLDDEQLRGYQTEFCQQSYSSNSNFEQQGNTDLSQHYRNLKYHLSAEYQAGENHFFGLRIERGALLRGSSDYLMLDDTRLNGMAYDLLRSETHTDDNSPGSWSANTYYNGRLGKWELDWNFDYFQNRQTNHAVTQENALDGLRNVEAHSSSDNQLYASRWVAAHPLAHGQLKIGAEIDWLQRDNTYEISQQSIRDDQSKVNEQQYAAFAEYALPIPGIGMINGGLRYEYVAFDYLNRTDPSQDVCRRSHRLYPNVSFSTQWGELQTSISYAAKTRRPDFRALRSNIEYNNRFTLSTGNPKLKDQTGHQVTLNMRWRYLSGSLHYLCQKDGIYDWTHPYDDQGTVLINWVNLEKPIHEIGGFFNLTNTFGRWTPSASLGFQQQALSFDLSDPREATGVRTVNYNRPMFLFNMDNTYKLPSRRDDGFGAWIFQLNSEFLSNFHYGNAEIRNCFWNLQCSVQKSWLENDALTLRLQFNDIAHMAHHNVRIDLGDYIMTQTHINGVSRSVYDPQTISLTLRYKFNTTKRKYKGSGAGEDIKARI